MVETGADESSGLPTIGFYWIFRRPFLYSPGKESRMPQNPITSVRKGTYTGGLP
jgi:hypothetical protein